MKLGFVEDDQDAREIFTRKLREAGYDCASFGTASGLLDGIRPGTYDLLIVDVRLPDCSGIKLLQTLREREIHTPCVLVTAFSSLEYAREALNANASYLLEKPFSIADLRRVIDKVMREPGPIPYRVDRGLATLQLTPREEEIARLVLKGLSNAEISRVAGLSEKTVKHYITQVFDKAGVSSRAELFSEIFPV